MPFKQRLGRGLAFVAIASLLTVAALCPILGWQAYQHRREVVRALRQAEIEDATKALQELREALQEFRRRIREHMEGGTEL